MEGLILLYDAIEQALPDIEQHSPRQKGAGGGQALVPGGVPRFAPPGAPTRQGALGQEVGVVRAWLSRAKRLRDEFIRLGFISLTSIQKYQDSVLDSSERRIYDWARDASSNLP